MSSKAGGSVIPCSQNSDNQPIDLAQKSHLARIAEIGPVKNAAGLVQIGGNLIPTNAGHMTSSKPCIKNEGNRAFVCQTNQPSGSNIAVGSALNLVAPTVGTLKNLSQVTSLSINSPMVNSPPSAHMGCHIPRGPAYVANIAARSQNVASIVRTTTPSTLSISGGRSNIGPRVMPMSTTGSNWIGRATPAVIQNKVQPNRGPMNTGRSNQNSVSNVVSYGQAIKSTGLSTNKIQKGASIKSGIGDTIRMQTPKGLNIAHAISSGQKYISNIVTGGGGGRTMSSGSSSSSDNIFSPCSSLVTSLASSGTTITPHPVTNRSQPSSIAVRITSAPTSASQVAIQSNSSFGAITLTETGVVSPCGTILTHHPATITRTQNIDHHIPVKTPIVRSPHGTTLHHGKISASGIPTGTQITFPGSKLISQPVQNTAHVALNISAVTPKTTLNIPSTTNAPFHSRSATIGRVTGTGIPMAKMVSHTAPAIVHPPTTSSPVTIVGANLPTTTPNSTDCHPSVLVQRSSHAAVSVTAERIVSSLPQYSITTPYYLDSGQGSFSVNSAIVPQSGTHFFPSTINSASLRIPSSNNCASSSSDNPHPTTLPTHKVNSSPRPSILRKRPDLDGSSSKVVKNLTAALSLPIISPPSPKRPESRGNGNISSTTASANSSPGIACGDDSNGSQVKIECIEPSFSDESMHAAANVLSLALGRRNFNSSLKNMAENGFQAHVPLNIPNTMDGVSPRKKPRKQQLMGNELQESRVDEEEIDNYLAVKKIKLESSPFASAMEDEPNSEETPLHIREEETPSPEPNSNQRPHMTLISAYRHGWKARNNHFLRYSDIRLKDERKKTVEEIANQNMVVQKANGWKVVHLTGQFEDLTHLEMEVVDRLETMLLNLEKFHPKKCYKDFEKDVNNLSELYRANIQRSKNIQTQMKDGKLQMTKIFDHKGNIMDIITKYSNKRVIRRKERL